MPGYTLKMEDCMIQDKDLSTGEGYDSTKIIWQEDDKYAIIAFLLMSLNKKADKDGLVRFDDLFGLNEKAPEGEEESSEVQEQRKTRDTIIRECERFLDSLDRNERYDAIQDEIDKFIEGADGLRSTCTIGGSYASFSSSGQNRLEGGAYRLWDLVKLVVFDADYNGDKKRLLKHLVRKWNLDQSVLPVLESSAKIIPEIARQREELAESDKPYREVKARLAELDTEEKEVWNQLKKLGIAGDRATSASIAGQFRLINAMRSISGLELIGPDINELEKVAEEAGDEEEDYNIGDRIVDGICTGIETVGDIIAAPFNFLTDKLNGL
jgi:hypothetical protein